MSRTNYIAARLATDLQRDFGLTYEQALGVVGNLAHESGGFNTLQEISPLVAGSRGGYGYAQWTGPRRRNFERYARDNNLDPASYEANYGFLKHEIETDPYERRQFMRVKQAKTAEEATRIVSENYLRPGIPHMDSRLAWAGELASVADNPALTAIDSAVAPTPMPRGDALSARANATPPVPMPRIRRAPGTLVADTFAALPTPSQSLRATDPVAPELIPELRVPYAKSSPTDVEGSTIVPGAPLGNLAYNLPQDMTPPPALPSASQTPAQISGPVPIMAPIPMPRLQRVAPQPMPRPATRLQVGIAPPGYVPRPAVQSRMFGQRLPGRIGLLQQAAGSALNPAGPERRQIRSTMRNVFNPGVQSSQEVRDRARKTGNHSGLPRGDRKYNISQNRWEVK